MTSPLDAYQAALIRHLSQPREPLKFPQHLVNSSAADLRQWIIESASKIEKQILFLQDALDNIVNLSEAENNHLRAQIKEFGGMLRKLKAAGEVQEQKKANKNSKSCQNGVKLTVENSEVDSGAVPNLANGGPEAPVVGKVCAGAPPPQITVTSAKPPDINNYNFSSDMMAALKLRPQNQMFSQRSAAYNPFENCNTVKVTPGVFGGCLAEKTPADEQLGEVSKSLKQFRNANSAKAQKIAANVLAPVIQKANGNSNMDQAYAVASSTSATTANGGLKRSTGSMNGSLIEEDYNGDTLHHLFRPSSALAFDQENEDTKTLTRSMFFSTAADSRDATSFVVPSGGKIKSVVEESICHQYQYSNGTYLACGMAKKPDTPEFLKKQNVQNNSESAEDNGGHYSNATHMACGRVKKPETPEFLKKMNMQSGCRPAVNETSYTTQITASTLPNTYGMAKKPQTPQFLKTLNTENVGGEFLADAAIQNAHFIQPDRATTAASKLVSVSGAIPSSDNFSGNNFCDQKLKPTEPAPVNNDGNTKKNLRKSLSSNDLNMTYVVGRSYNTSSNIAKGTSRRIQLLTVNEYALFDDNIQSKLTLAAINSAIDKLNLFAASKDGGAEVLCTRAELVSLLPEFNSFQLLCFTSVLSSQGRLIRKHSENNTNAATNQSIFMCN